MFIVQWHELQMLIVIPSLRMAQIPHEPIMVDLKRGEHFTEEFKRINRFQKVPCLVDESENDFKLSETIAIFR
jgi:glutathione S-transferase